MKIVLDSSAFINAGIFEGDGDFFTVQEVLRELRDLKSKSLADSARVNGRLRVTSPSAESVDAVKLKAAEIGCIKMSETDILVLALAFELHAKLITDDFSMQNLAAYLGMEYDGVVRGRIKGKKKFK